MNEIGFDPLELKEFYEGRRNKLVGFSGIGCYHPIVSYLKWILDDATKIYVCGEFVEITQQDLVYKLPTNAKLRKFVWRVNATFPFGRPIFGGDTICCL